jgi:trehalose 6-phosphate phosphatase
MKPLLARENVELLAQFSWCRVLLAFDFDGTLAPIVAQREAAFMRPQTTRLLQQACQLYPCAVISGRTQRDLRRRLAAARVPFALGNHGLEAGMPRNEFASQVAAALPRLQLALDGVPGLEIEDKTHSIAVHYRRSRRKQHARAAIAQAAKHLPSRMRLISGKLVINLVPASAPNKGDAVLSLRARAGADTALYVGDDVSDEDVFSLDQPGRLLGVRVGRSARSRAPYFLRDQSEIDALLSTLIQLRAQVRPSAARWPSSR